MELFRYIGNEVIPILPSLPGLNIRLEPGESIHKNEYYQNFSGIHKEEDPALRVLMRVFLHNSTLKASHYDISQFEIKSKEQKLELVKKLYYSDEFDSIKSFISDNFFLADLLIEAHPQLKDHFGTNLRVDLVLRTDPEESYKQLFGYLRTPMPIDEAQASLDSFDDNWFLDHLVATKGLLNFNLIFS